MSNIKVVDVNNEEAKQEEAIEQPIEKAKEEVNEIVEEPPQETANGSLNSNSAEVETKEAIEETQKQDAKPCVKAQDTKPSVKAQDKLVRCPKCSREMKLKNYRYGHQQRCQGGIENKPVKPHTKVRAKPKAQPIIQDVEEEIREALPSGNPQLTQPVKKQILQPTNPLSDARQSLASIRNARNEPHELRDITNHYQLLQQQYIQQKQAKYQNLCQNMFAPKSKKR